MDLSKGQIFEHFGRISFDKGWFLLNLTLNEGRAVFKLVGQNQAELAWLDVLRFWRPCKSKHSDFQVAYIPTVLPRLVRMRIINLMKKTL